VCKLPKKIMDEIWAEGDKLSFQLTFDTAQPTKPKIDVEYMKKNGTR